MCKSKRTIEQFTYDIQEFITKIKSKVNGISYEDFIKLKMINLIGNK